MNLVTYVTDEVSMISRHLTPNVVTLKSLIHLRKNVITFRVVYFIKAFNSTDQRCAKRVVREP